MKSPKEQPKPKRTNLYLALALAVITFLVFANSIGNDYNLDDELVTNHQRLTSKGISAISEIFASSYYDNQAGSSYEYRPVALASFAIEHTFFGEGPQVSHFINVLLYALTVMLLFLTLRSVLPGDNLLVSTIATLLFALHPLHTEVVDSIKNRDEILCFLGGTLAWRYADKFLKVENRQWLSYALFVLFFVFGILSKRSILSFAFIIPLSLLWFSDVKAMKLLLISFPLAVAFYFLSPAPYWTVNLAVAFVIILAPFALKYFLYPTNIGIHPFGHFNNGVLQFLSFTSQGEQEETAINKSFVVDGSFIWCTVALLLGFGIVYSTLVLNDRTLILYQSIGLVLLSVFSAPRVKTILAFYSITMMLFLAFSFNSPVIIHLMILAYGALYYKGNDKQKLVAGLLMVVSALCYIAYRPMMGTAIEMVIRVGLFAFFLRLERTKWVAFVFFIYALDVVGSYVLGAHNWGFSLLALGTIGYYLIFRNKTYIPYLVTMLLIASIGVIGWQLIQVHGNERAYKAFGVSHQEIAKMQVVPTQTLVPAAGRKLDNVENPLSTITWTQKAATSLVVMGKYVQLLIIPVTLRFYYGYNQIVVVGLSDVVVWVVFVLLLASIVFSFWFRKRHPVLALGLVSLWIGLFFISNMPVLVAGIVAERLVTVASLGFCLAVAAGIASISKGQSIQSFSELTKQPFILGLVGALVLGYSIRSISRNSDWKDRFTLYSHDIIDLPNSAKAQQLMGIEYLTLAAKTKDTAKQSKQLDLAKGFLIRSMEIAPDFHSPVYNMAYLYSIKQDCDNAVPWMLRSLQMEPTMSAAVFHYSIGKCYDDKNKLDSAAIYYDKAISETPSVLEYYTRLSYAYYREGKVKESVTVNLRAIKQFPNEFDPYINAAKGYLSLNDNSSALSLFEGAFKLHPNDLGLAKMIVDLSNRTGNITTAAQYMQIASSLDVK